MSETSAVTARVDWQSDFFGTLNELAPEPVGGIARILEAMSTLPAFRDARQWLFQHLRLAAGSSLLEMGCGTGTALPEILPLIGSKGRFTGFDPTRAFVDRARARESSVVATNAHTEIGDLREV